MDTQACHYEILTEQPGLKISIIEGLDAVIIHGKTVNHGDVSFIVSSVLSMACETPSCMGCFDQIQCCMHLSMCLRPG